MNKIEIINKKKNKEKLSYEEMKYFIDNYCNGKISNEDMISLLKQIYDNGMDEEETYYLTKAYIESGEVVDLSDIGLCADKHSTGGVGDKTTFIVCPIVAACGVNVVKFSGKSLGNTGGTIDKLESIPGFNTKLSIEDIKKQVKELKLSLSALTLDIVPADKLIYDLRDKNNLVDSIPLIAASIMSKKIASGASTITLDIKVGRGAFMKNIEDATKLASLMINIGKRFNKKVIAILTNMDYPLGQSIGNSIEVLEALEVLKGNGDKDFIKLCLTLATYMVSITKDISLEDAQKEVKTNLYNGKALEVFKKVIKAQGGDVEKIKLTTKAHKIKSREDGYIVDIDPYKLSCNINKYIRKNNTINYDIGIVLNKKINDYIKKDETLAIIYGDCNIEDDEILNSYIFSKEKIEKKKIVYGVIR
ncbi:MAG TPA: thymidine phosphorylase [Bacilli bacterium]|nr:thymidine phosphorylase [Bacilli bacterium]